MVIAFLEPNILNVMAIIGLTSWMGLARLVRGECLSLRERDFILAARGLNLSTPRILFVHLLPNLVSPILVAGALGVAYALLATPVYQATAVVQVEKQLSGDSLLRETLDSSMGQNSATQDEVTLAKSRYVLGKTVDALGLTVRVEPTRIPRDFQFRVRANDGDTGWQSVQVSPPPVLVPLDGRPSPQIRLDYPPYTDLTPIDLPDGSGVIECVAGTRVTLRAATDRPVVASGGITELADLEALSRASAEDLQQIAGIGPSVAESVAEWFARPANQNVIEKLKAAGVWPQGGAGAAARSRASDVPRRDRMRSSPSVGSTARSSTAPATPSCSVTRLAQWCMP